MTGIYAISADPSEVLAKVRDVFESTPTNGASYIVECGPFVLAHNDSGVYLNLAESDTVWQVYSATVRRSLMDRLLFFVADDVTVCFPFIASSVVPDFHVDLGCPAESRDTTEGICDSVCEGFPEPDASGVWVPTKWSDGSTEWNAQINHRYLINIDDEAVICCEDFEQPFEVLAVEAHNSLNEMPGLHVLTVDGITFYFRTELDDASCVGCCGMDDDACGGA